MSIKTIIIKKIETITCADYPRDCYPIQKYQDTNPLPGNDFSCEVEYIPLREFIDANGKKIRLGYTKDAEKTIGITFKAFD